MEKGDISDAVMDHCPNLSKAMIENAKLKYRIQILQAVSSDIILSLYCPITLKVTFYTKKKLIIFFNKRNFLLYTKLIDRKS